MCGISGILGSGDAIKRLTRMTQAMRHRGPDSTGIYESDIDAVYLGHNRLSIIDLSENGKQPFFSTDRNYVIVLNGEIYNYKELKQELEQEYSFQSMTDTEVVLASYIKWGKDCLHKFTGMFAFAIWHIPSKKLFAARDRFGVKPFYYHVNEKELVFASEIKAIWAAGIEKKMNLPVWSSYLSYGTFGSIEDCFWQDIKQLPGGYTLEYSIGSLPQITKWYDFEKSIAARTEPTEEKLEKYFNRLQKSIEYRFRSDVPVGFNVSGGLDSSLLLTLINRTFPSSSIEAFTFTTGNSDYDELPWVREMLKLSPSPLNVVETNAQKIPEIFEQVSSFEDEPFGGIPTLTYSMLFREASLKGIKVLLDGQGMDETWAGYDYYHNDSGANVQGLNSSPYKTEILEDDFKDIAFKETYPTPFDNKLQNLQYRDLFHSKIPRALRFNDRISMMHSTELREPFLDHELVEIGFSMPLTEKYKEGITKYRIREMLSKIQSQEVSFAPKRALQTPQREWLSGELREMVEFYIQKAETSGFFKKGSMEKEYRDFVSNPVQSVALWQYISVGKYL